MSHLKCALDAAYWRSLGQQLLQQELNKQKFDTAAKNIIFFLGDGKMRLPVQKEMSVAFTIANIGMSISTITAARIWKGQKRGNTGEEEQLTFDKFPYAALSRV